MDPPPSSQCLSPDNRTPPPSSQSHFDKFQNFTPSQNAPFNQEFARLALSQSWIPGSQEYTKERTIAMRQELKTHYFSSQILEEEPSEEEILKGYQDLCIQVGIPPSDTAAECKDNLKKKLVNIVDLIDARRTNKKVRVWRDFQAFRKYTLQKEHRISVDEAKKDGGYLASLLQRLRDRHDETRFRFRAKKAGMAKRR